MSFPVTLEAINEQKQASILLFPSPLQSLGYA